MTLSRILFAAAALYFVVALLIALGAFTGGNEAAWQDGGFIALALGLLNPRVA